MRDDDGEPTLARRPRPMRSGNQAILIVIGSLALGGALFAGMVAFFYVTANRPADRGGQPGVVKRVTRGEFTKLVDGKTQDEVIAAVGRPDSTSEGISTLWVYKDRTFDPVSGKNDGQVHLHFNARGIVTTVSY